MSFLFFFTETISKLQKKYNYVSQKLHKAKDSLSDMEKKVEQLTQHLKESVLEQRGSEQEKHQAGADYIRQEKTMQAKICNMQEQKNEMKVSLRPRRRWWDTWALPFICSQPVTPLGSLPFQTCLQKTEEELEEALKKLAVSEAATEVSKRYQLELEEERSRLIKDLDTIEWKVWTASTGLTVSL